MKHRTLLVAALFCLVASVLSPAVVQAAKGTPQSADFGFGAQVDLQGIMASESIQASAALQLDWYGIDLDWAVLWPEPASQPDLKTLDASIQAASVQGVPVLLTLRNAPAWAMTSAGPDPALTSWFVTSLAGRYPGALQAVELFPAANTQAGWGAAPDPAAYAALLQAVRGSLTAAGQPILLPAGGLVPIAPDSTNGDWDDLAYLSNLYAAAGTDLLPIISIRFYEILGDSLTQPGPDHRVLRHYEEIRQVMLANNHSSGILWITQLSTPANSAQGSETADLDLDSQLAWLVQAYRQLRAQLYIGVVFYDQLNPVQPSEAVQGGSYSTLIQPDLGQHPFFHLLQRLIAQNNRNFGETTQDSDPQIKRIRKDRA